jgi:hypothetical protein
MLATAANADVAALLRQDPDRRLPHLWQSAFRQVLLKVVRSEATGGWAPGSWAGHRYGLLHHQIGAEGSEATALIGAEHGVVGQAEAGGAVKCLPVAGGTGPGLDLKGEFGVAGQAGVQEGGASGLAGARIGPAGVQGFRLRAMPAAGRGALAFPPASGYHEATPPPA